MGQKLAELRGKPFIHMTIFGPGRPQVRVVTNPGDKVEAKVFGFRGSFFINKDELLDGKYGFWWYKHPWNLRVPKKANQMFSLPPGLTPEFIADQLSGRALAMAATHKPKDAMLQAAKYAMYAAGAAAVIGIGGAYYLGDLFTQKFDELITRILEAGLVPLG